MYFNLGVAPFKPMKACFSIVFILLTSVASFAQELPPVGFIDLFGLRTVSAAEVRSVLKIKAGDEALDVLKAIEENRRLLRSLPNVEDASINVVCCDELNGSSIVYVGIRENGVPALNFRSAPGKKIRLPEDVLQAGRNFESAFLEALAEKDFSEDDSEGHSFFGNESVREVQKGFVLLAERYLRKLRGVLRESADSGDRALAAQIIAYHGNKRAIAGDLVYASRDPDERVRNNATRALIVLAVYASTHPDLNIKIPADHFVHRLGSLDWTDRNKSLGVLEVLTRNRDLKLLRSIKKKALRPLAEMASWKNPGHAQSAFFILGRIGGMPENEIETLWKGNDRQRAIEGLLDRIKNK